MAAKSEFIVMCNSRILSVLVPGDEDADLWINGRPNKELEEKLQLVHDLIKKILEVIPMIPVTMRKKIPELFPYGKHESLKLAGYMYNIMSILDYCPSMMHDIFDSVFET